MVDLSLLVGTATLSGLKPIPSLSTALLLFLHSLDALFVAGLAVEAVEAVALSEEIVADASARAVTTGFITEAADDIGGSGTLLLLACGPAIAGVTETAGVFICIPRQFVRASSLTG